jgi:hypothetical protein
MTESDLRALLDAHDALVTACVDARLTLGEFLAAYDDFPSAYALEEAAATAEERALLQLFRKRIAFHSRVQDVLSGLHPVDSANTVDSEVGRFVPVVALLRLRELTARYPDHEAEPPQERLRSV